MSDQVHQVAASTPLEKKVSRGILFVIPLYRGRSGGIDPLWLEMACIARALEPLVGKCDVFTPVGLLNSSELPMLAIADGTNSHRSSFARRLLHRLPKTGRVLLGDGRAFLRARRLRKGIRDLEGNGYAAVIQLHQRFHDAGQLAARLWNVPFVLKVDALEVREEHTWGVRRPIWGTYVERLGEVRIMKGADVVLPLSDTLDGQLASVGVPDDRRMVWENAVDLESFHPAGATNDRRRDRADPRIVVGWAGSFRPFHALHLLAPMLDDLRARVPNIALWLVGSGPMLPHVRDQLKRHADVVTFVGPVAAAEMPDWLRSFDIALLPADKGEFHYSPLKLYEYLGCGVPVVAAAVGQVSEVLGSDRGGILVPPGDPDAMADAIERLAHDDGLRLRMSGEARELAEEWGSWDARAARLIAALEERGLVSAGDDARSSLV